MRFTAKHTMISSFTGYIIQAIVNNLAPLLFVTFQKEFDISLEKIGLIIFINFFTQILTDLASAKYVDRLGYRKSVCIAHICTFMGIGGLGIFPYVFPDAYTGVLIATVISAVGGGLLEVVISPIVEAIPGDKKNLKMSLLHSFYCWGQVGVVLFSTIFFALFGISNWRMVCFIWAALPLVNFFAFLKVPMWSLVSEEKKMSIKKLMTSKLFFAFLILMLCSGAAELAMAQWVSFFAEAGLKIDKSLGDIFGTCMFALLMGISRTFWGIKAGRFKASDGLILSAAMCVISYLIAALSKNPVLSLFGCVMCGLSVGFMWPGTYSFASETFKNGGAGMFALLALAGDIGCTTGPTLVGNISSLVEKNVFPVFLSGGDIREIGLKTGLLFIAVFPLLMCPVIIIIKKRLSHK